MVSYERSVFDGLWLDEGTNKYFHIFQLPLEILQQLLVIIDGCGHKGYWDLLRKARIRPGIVLSMSKRGVK